jgi:hypothetical protein
LRVGFQLVLLGLHRKIGCAPIRTRETGLSPGANYVFAGTAENVGVECARICVCELSPGERQEDGFVLCYG